MSDVSGDTTLDFNPPHNEGRSKVMGLAQAVETYVKPGDIVHVAYSDARPNAAIRQTDPLVRRNHAWLHRGIGRAGQHPARPGRARAGRQGRGVLRRRELPRGQAEPGAGTRGRLRDGPDRALVTVGTHCPPDCRRSGCVALSRSLDARQLDGYWRRPSGASWSSLAPTATPAWCRPCVPMLSCCTAPPLTPTGTSSLLRPTVKAKRGHWLPRPASLRP